MIQYAIFFAILVYGNSLFATPGSHPFVCNSHISTTEGVIEIKPAELFPQNSTRVMDFCKDYVVGTLSRICSDANEILTDDVKIIIAVEINQNTESILGEKLVNMSSLMSAKCNKSLFGKWSFNVDVEDHGYSRASRLLLEQDVYPTKIIHSER